MKKKVLSEDIWKAGFTMNKHDRLMILILYLGIIFSITLHSFIIVSTVTKSHDHISKKLDRTISAINNGGDSSPSMSWGSDWETPDEVKEVPNDMAWIAKNAFLTQSQMENNVLMAAPILSEYFTTSAMAAMFGNMQSESSINPGIWENLKPFEGGYGLVQWTPYTKYSEYAGADWQNNGDKQCYRIIYELRYGLQWSKEYYHSIDMSFQEFANSTDSPEFLAHAFLSNYENPAKWPQPQRGVQARAWYNFLVENGYPDDSTGGGGVTPAELPIWLMFKMKEMNNI